MAMASAAVPYLAGGDGGFCGVVPMYARVISKVGWFVIQHFIVLVVGLEVMMVQILRL
jgi:hypothetical protein